MHDVLFVKRKIIDDNLKCIHFSSDKTVSLGSPEENYKGFFLYRQIEGRCWECKFSDRDILFVYESLMRARSSVCIVY